MASIFLELNETGVVVANSNEKVFGQQGHESVVMLAGVTGVSLDQNLEQITLSGDKADYTFEQEGNRLHIDDGESRIVTIPVQTDDDGTRLVFDNDAAYDAVFVDGAIVLEDVTDLDPGEALQADAYSRSVTIAGIDQDSLIGTTDPMVAALYEGDSWLDLQSVSDPITYSFNETLPPEYTGSDTQGWEPVADSVRDVIDEVMAVADGVILPDIEWVGDNGLIRFNAATMDEGVAGYAYYPATGRGGDVFLDHEVGTDTPNGNTDPYGFGRSTIVHELGHALGLVHPFEGTSTLPDADDHTANTVMSYTDYRLLEPVFTGTQTGSGSQVNVTYDYVAPDRFMPYDIAVLQAVYGPDTAYQTSDNTYAFGTTPFYTTIWDAGGFDILDFSATTHYNEIDLTPGSHSYVNYRDLDTQIAEQQAVYQDQLNTDYYDDWVADTLTGRQDDLYTGENALGIAYGTIIEAVTGGPAGNRFVDNNADNYLTGGAGDDLFYLGSGGFDRINGGGGYDLVMLEAYDSDQVEMGEYEEAFFLVAEGFAVEMVEIAGVQFADQLYMVG
jgi:hypothetical protein